MAALPDSGPSNGHGANQAEGEGEPKRKRARSVGVAAGGGGAASASAGVRKEKKGSSSMAAAAAPASAARALPESAAAWVVDVTVEDADALDCGVCFLPLKAPIFQCEVGHVVCSPCCDKLKATGKCHVCGVATSSYRRCHAMERLVESIHVPCPHAAHGCTMRLAYHDREGHRLVCPHAPCRCPGEACTFVGSTAALLDHFSEAHSWPCITNAKADDNGEFAIHLHDGFNLLLADCSTANTKQGATASVQCLLLLTVARQPLGRTISMICIDPHASDATGHGQTSKEMECEIWYSLYTHLKSLRCGNPLIDHYQRSRFRVACTDLTYGLPKPEDGFQFFVPTSLLIGDHDKDGIQVRVRITIK
ncbi:unnamed protein product [Urochloa decumbens]|uniref:RING-type E3 ubiquitin transferase n=1 Tax=Urochloa decumbens TaxID=240449 RepID=A0ABC8W506_9POAL